MFKVTYVWLYHLSFSHQLTALTPIQLAHSQQSMILSGKYLSEKVDALCSMNKNLRSHRKNNL